MRRIEADECDSLLEMLLQHTDLEGSSSKDVGGVPDVEELCTLCEPLPTPGRVTMFPMKVEKKKAREELDIVNVIEWRSQRDNERWFLLVRRPEGGKLSRLLSIPKSRHDYLCSC